jgi:hypothetical protein
VNEVKAAKASPERGGKRIDSVDNSELETPPPLLKVKNLKASQSLP